MEGAALAAPTVALIFGAHMFYGASTSAASLAYAGLALLLAAIAVPLNAGLLPLIGRKARIAGPLFALVLLLGVAQLFPPLFGEPHPFWSFLDGASAVTLDRDATERELLKLSGLGALFLVGAMIGLDDRRASAFFRIFLWAGLAYSVWAFMEFIVDPGRLFGVERQIHVNRLGASFLSANSAASAFACLTLVALGHILRRAKTGFGSREEAVRKLAWPAIALGFAVTCLALTGSRAGIACASVAVLFLLGWEGLSRIGRQSAGPVAAAAAFVLIGGAIVWGLSGEIASDRLAYASRSFQDRTGIFSVHWEAIRAVFWRGYGLGTFNIVNDYLQTAENVRLISGLGSLHNVYLQWLEEGGAAMSAAMWACLAAVLFEIVVGSGVRRRNATWLRVIVALSLAFLLHGAFDFALQVMAIAGMWSVLLGVGLGLSMPSGDRPRH